MKRLLSFMVVAVVAAGFLVGCVNLPKNLDGVWEAKDGGKTQTITIIGTSFTFVQDSPSITMTRTLKDSREKGKKKGSLTITLTGATSNGSAVPAAVGFSWMTEYILEQTTKKEYLLKMKVPDSFSATASMSENTYKRK